MISERTPKLRSDVFATLELDTDALTSQIAIAVPARNQGRYRGVVTDNNNGSKEFSLVVLPPPAEPSVAVNASEDWAVPPVFSVVQYDDSNPKKKVGYLVVHTTDDAAGPRQIRIFNTTDVLFDNQKIGLDSAIVLKLFRPGKHLVTDKTGGGVCEVTVTYPPPPPPNWPTDKVIVNVLQDPKDPTKTQMQPDKISISPLQPVVFNTQNGTHLVTDLLAVTDRDGSTFVTTRTAKGNRVNVTI